MTAVLKKIYLEITNVCNLSCSFCPGTVRKKHFLSIREFTVLAEKLVGYTDYLYLHLMGEPLLHPELASLIDIASSLGFKVCLTTNGTLLSSCRDVLLARAEKIYKISISLHCADANSGMENADGYYESCIDFLKESGSAGVISVVRLWNLENGSSNAENGKILGILKGRFHGEWVDVRGGQRIGKGCYLEWGERFEWPDENGEEKNVKFCMGLRDHIGILCDGTVVPCCLDCNGTAALGNLFERELDEIISCERAKRIFDGFTNRMPSEELCRKCGYAERFV